MIVFIILSLFVGFYFALVVSLLLVAIFVHMDSRLPYMTALVFLVIAALFMALSYLSFANWFASVSYYALAIGVLLDLYDYVRSGEENKVDTP